MRTGTKLSRPEHEMFLILLVEQELSPSEAYAKVYPGVKPASAHSAASRLLGSVKIQTRKAELEAAKELVRRGATGITADFISKELFEVAAAAKNSKQYAAASAALMGAAKLHGFLIDKQQVDMVVRRPSINPFGPDQMTEQGWLQEFGQAIIEHQSTDQQQDQSSDQEEAMPTTDEGIS